MKRKIGKIITPILILTVILAICFYPLIKPVYARTIGKVSDKLGAFTGPESGTAQDDNVKASLDLLHDLVGPALTRGTGEVYFVDSAATGGATGLDWENAKITLDAGVGLCTHDRGDTILVAAGHSEVYDAANEADLDMRDITVIGMGEGENRPLCDYTGVGGELVIGADDVSIHNFQFKANVDSVVQAIDVETGVENYLINRCRFYVELAGTDEFDDSIMIADNSDNGTITNCVFELGAGDAQSAVYFIGADYLEVSDCRAYGDYGVACIENATTAGVHVTIKDNILFNGTVGGDAGLNTIAVINFKSDTSGTIIGNKCFCDVANPQLAIVAADCYLSGNTYSEDEADGAGQIIGTRAGENYVISVSQDPVKSGSTNMDLFDVDGGPILIKDFYGLVTTLIGTTATNYTLQLDADSGWVNYDFSTTVAITSLSAGDRIVFSAANESTLTPLSGTSGGATSLFKSWLCGEGMIEGLASSATNDGVITWYMEYTPLADGTTVTAQ